MKRSDSSWPPWPPRWPPSDHSNELEHRLTVTEIKVHDLRQDHDTLRSATEHKIVWLERGLQALAYIVLTIVLWQAPSKAVVLAEAILGLVKR